MNPRIRHLIKESIQVKEQILEDQALLETIEQCAELMTEVLAKGNKVLFCGNGGSAADAQHLAAELSGRFYMDRDPLFAEALHVNTSQLTAVANDYDFSEIYSRAVKAKGRKGDLLVAISTSGNSPNVIKAVAQAKALDMHVIGMTSEGGGDLKNACDHWIYAPSKDTMRTQESHIMIGHLICELVEKNIFGK